MGWNDKDVMPTLTGTDFDADFAVAESLAQAGRERTSQMVTNIECQLRIGRTGEDFKIAVHAERLSG